MKPTSARVLDPRGSFLQTWNKVFVISCLVSVSVDSLFLYAPAIDGDIGCLYLDDKLEKIACLLRSLTDALYLLRMAFQFSTAFAAPTPPGAFGRGVLVDDLLAIAKHYLSTYFLVDVLAILPLPQVVRYPRSVLYATDTCISIDQGVVPSVRHTLCLRLYICQVFVWVVRPHLQSSEVMNAKNVLMFMILLQYVPRLVRIIPLYLEITRSAGTVVDTAWPGAAFNLLVYILASHVSSLIIYQCC
jgi:cyclic nucleotide gated channel, plant